MTTVVFVCWGNICRSPMAERVARSMFEQAGLDVEVTSAATSREELGNPIDPRAQRVLRRAGYSTDGHRARQITADEIAAADYVIAMEQVHVDRMEIITGHVNDNVHLLTAFNPDAAPGTGIDDPWYGGERGFEKTLREIQAALPGLVAELRGFRG